MNQDNQQEQSEFQDLLEKAQFYILNNKYSEALKVLKKALTQNQDDPTVHYLYGLALEGSNQQEEAKEHYRRTLELDPQHSEAKQRLDRLIGE